jgi:hypothetical protein
MQAGEIKMLNTKLKTLNKLKCQKHQTQNVNLLSFRFWICLGFSV